MLKITVFIQNLLFFACLWFDFGSVYAQQSSWLNFEQEGEAGFYPEKKELTSASEPFREDLLEVAHARLPYGSVIEIINLANGKKVKARVNDRIFKKNYIIGLNKATAAALDVSAGTQVPAKLKVLQVDVKREGIQLEKELYLENLKKKVEQEIDRMADSILALEAEEEKKAKEVAEKQQKVLERVRNHVGVYDIYGKIIKTTAFGVQIGNFSTLEAALKRVTEYDEKKLKYPVFLQTIKQDGKLRYKVIIESRKSKSECYPVQKKLVQSGFSDAFVLKFP
jgi:rare lipoprotein A